MRMQALILNKCVEKRLIVRRIPFISGSLRSMELLMVATKRVVRRVLRVIGILLS
jgi:hypothetical protein